MSALQQDYLPAYTWDDYINWEGRWELIEGIPWAMSPAPSIQHQAISSRINAQLSKLLQSCSQCHVLLPVDWKINQQTVVQPDNLVVCGELPKQYLSKAPEIIFEILSPATARKDLNIKFELYQKEGVKYYIIVNPEDSIAKIFQLNSNGCLVKKLDAHKESWHFDLGDCAFDFDFSTIWG